LHVKTLGRKVIKGEEMEQKSSQRDRSTRGWGNAMSGILLRRGDEEGPQRGGAVSPK